MVTTLKMGSNGPPGIVSVLFNKDELTLVLLSGPDGPCFIGESSVSAVAHLGIPALYLRGDFVESCVLVPAEFDQQLVLLCRPGPFGLPISLLLEVFSREDRPFFFWRGRNFFEGRAFCGDILRNRLMGGYTHIVEVLETVMGGG